MKLGHKYFRGVLVKMLILTIPILWLFWDHVRGKGNPNDEKGALIIVAVLAVVGNAGVYIAMVRAKRREQASEGKITPPNS